MEMNGRAWCLHLSPERQEVPWGMTALRCDDSLQNGREHQTGSTVQRIFCFFSIGQDGKLPLCRSSLF